MRNFSLPLVLGFLLGNLFVGSVRGAETPRCPLAVDQENHHTDDQEADDEVLTASSDMRLVFNKSRDDLPRLLERIGGFCGVPDAVVVEPGSRRLTLAATPKLRLDSSSALHLRI
jgi:hypothetical protein